MDDSIADIEAKLRIKLPPRHRAALLDPGDPIHDHKEMLGLEKDDSFNILEVNNRQRQREWKGWPEHLIAFATNGCGDYFAYDTRNEPYRVYYIEPNDTVSESIRECDAQGFVFPDFDAWYAYACGAGKGTTNRTNPMNENSLGEPRNEESATDETRM